MNNSMPIYDPWDWYNIYLHLPRFTRDLPKIMGVTYTFGCFFYGKCIGTYTILPWILCAAAEVIVVWRLSLRRWKKTRHRRLCREAWWKEKRCVG